MKKSLTIITSVIILLLNNNSLMSQNNSEGFCYNKGDVSVGLFYGRYDWNTYLVYTSKNKQDILAGQSPAMGGPIGIQIEQHRTDNFICGLTYSYASANSGEVYDQYMDNYTQEYEAHQITLKSGFGWLNHKNSGTMLYSAAYVGFRRANTKTLYVYRETANLGKPMEPFPIEVNSFAYHLTLIGYKGRYVNFKEGNIGIDLELGFGCKGILSGGINYTFN